MKTYSVVIVDGHVLLSQAIAHLVDSFEEFETLYICNNGQELLDKLKQNSVLPDIVLMDICMPELNGIQTTQLVSEIYPRINILALTADEDEHSIINMLRAGAKGYLFKSIEKSELEIALVDVITQGYHHTKNVSDVLIKFLMGESESKKVNLKQQELQFIRYVCSEMTYKEIAKSMYRSPKTIDGYRDALFKKLQVKNKIGLVMYAIKHKLYTP
ncbi:response regulator transcription factor [Seonamhaeicola sp.]|uniref:response regulator transcription factor n=1 Tax=Seonamhaeicola sp. TaxID=1912245 RepID=UPI002624B788|nr:response regulator transcription factor [Seonamhaeicola sp.]